MTDEGMRKTAERPPMSGNWAANTVLNIDADTVPIYTAEEMELLPGPSQRPAVDVGQVIGGRYQIVDLLAKGGMSRLYCACDLRSAEHVVAIKEFYAGEVDRVDNWALVAAFMREANILTTIRHPHIVSATRFIQEAGNYYIVMEWLGGHNLSRELEAAPGGLPEAIVLEWAGQLCSALDYLHTGDPPVVFGDMKPSNIFLLETGRVKLVDFGIARYYYPRALNQTFRFGTPGFAAPEQYRAGRISPAADIYGLGRTLHCLLTGFDPAGQSTAAASFDFQPARQLKPEISAATSAALEVAMQRRPARRFQSVRELGQALGLNAAE
jgi:serine/threonine protein kinase